MNQVEEVRVKVHPGSVSDSVVTSSCTGTMVLCQWAAQHPFFVWTVSLGQQTSMCSRAGFKEIEGENSELQQII